jgi:hypothetical protein
LKKNTLQGFKLMLTSLKKWIINLMLNNVCVNCHSCPSWCGQADLNIRMLMFVKNYDNVTYDNLKC